MAIANIITDAAKGGLVTLASPGFGRATMVDFGAAGTAINYLLMNTTGAQVVDATKQGFTTEASFNTNELPTSGGYTVQGMSPGSQAVTVASHNVKVTTAAATWTSSTLSAYGVWLVRHAGAAASNDALLYFDFSGTGTGAITSTSATFTVTPAGGGLLTIT